MRGPFSLQHWRMDMTLAEFKAWFEGFTEDMESAPTTKQWKRIKDRVKQIDGTVLTREVVYRDRWWRDYWSAPIWNEPLVARYGSGTAGAVGLASAVSNRVMPDHSLQTTDLTALGKAEFASVA
jgi:hypothetical protein